MEFLSVRNAHVPIGDGKESIACFVNMTVVYASYPTLYLCAVFDADRKRDQ